MKTIDQLKLTGERALIRVDYNVPLDEGIVDDNFRIRASLATIRYCLDQGAAVILMSHLGRPKGKVVEEYSLLPVAEELRNLLGKEIVFSRDCCSDKALEVSRTLQAGQVHLLENLRFHPGEESNDPDFAAYLAKHGTVYVNDAFGTAHRAHASNVGVAAHFKEAGIGLLMAKEVQFLHEKMGHPAKPMVVILGGAKVSGKLELIRNLLEKADRMLIGGGMAFTFLKAQGKDVGKSLVDDALLEEAGAVIRLAADKGVELLLPTDVVAADNISPSAAWPVTPVSELDQDEIGVDLGPESCALFGSAIMGAKTILWNGPMGVFEYAPFQTGTEIVIASIIEATNAGAVSVIGGGDSAAAIDSLSDPKHFTHISTGGGASLELLGGQSLPALEALS